MARFDDLSRVPLQLLRLEWRKDWVECDWLMRSPDPWDEQLPERLAQERETQQALRDGLSLRNLVFESFPCMERAELRMFRKMADPLQELKLMMTGSLRRADEVLPRVASIAMQAKLCGFRFTLEEGVLESMTPHSAGCIFQ